MYYLVEQIADYLLVLRIVLLALCPRNDAVIPLARTKTLDHGRLLLRRLRVRIVAAARARDN